MDRLGVAIVNRDGALKCVMSENGKVIFEDSVRLPHDPDARKLATALRLLADQLGDEKSSGYKKFACAPATLTVI